MKPPVSDVPGASIVHDVMRAMGESAFVLPRTIRPLASGQRVIAPAFPVSGETVAGADPHATLLAWTGLLSRVPAGHVLALQPGDDTVAHMGELSAETLLLRGVVGAVIDGGCRDVARVRAIGLAVWHRYATPIDVVGRWLPKDFGAPVRIGDVRIAMGDILVADDDGIVRVPGALADRVLSEARAAMGQENRVRTAILAGEDPQQAYLRHGKF